MTYAITHEEVANTITHFLGIVLAPVMLLLFLYNVPLDSWKVLFSLIVFCVGVLSLYTSSTVYHLVLPSRAKHILRYFDHINIYVLIAASYTPILLCGIGGTLGWVVFGIEWGLVVAGTIFKICCLGKYPKVSLLLYILMGWSVIAIAKPIWEALPTLSIYLLGTEGFLYTLGAYFYAKDNAHRYYHAVWHVFVLLGTISHFFLIWSIF